MNITDLKLILKIMEDMDKFPQLSIDESRDGITSYRKVDDISVKTDDKGTLHILFS